MSYSFDIKDSKDLLAEFCARANEYRQKPLSSGSAVICAILSWHIVEWIYQEFDFIKKSHKDIVAFQHSLKNQCPSLSYMQDITNGSKHRGITRYRPVVRHTESHGGIFDDNVFNSNVFDVSCLRMKLDNGEVVDFDQEIEKVEIFLIKYFDTELNIHE